MGLVSALPSLALSLALLGCEAGCDGERGAGVRAPRAPAAPGDATAVAASTQPAGPQPAYLDAPAGSLDALFTMLDAADAKRPDARVLIAVFGDSHTAGDSMTSRLRVQWQRRFGDAGRGLVAAGRPAAKHYYQRDIRYGASGPWKAAVGGRTGDAEPFGIAGLRVYGERKGAQLWVETCADCLAGTRASQIEILYQAAPDRGRVRYRLDELPWAELSTRTAPIEPPHPARHVIPVPDGPHRLTIEHAGDGLVELYGVVLERNAPGVIVDSLGVVGRRLGSLRSWDWSIIGEQLATRDPRLVVLQYGTNEADDPDLDLEAVARYYDDTILRIRAAAPTASILILGPPDMATREAGKACDRPRRRPANVPVDAGVLPECEWKTPPVVREIIATQHAAAVRNKVAFFDTFAAMGGPDQMHGWVTAEPRAAFTDHVHLTDVGYQRWADLLSDALLGELERWRAARAAGP